MNRINNNFYQTRIFLKIELIFIIISGIPCKACDPWAVHCAKSFSKKNGSELEFTENQAKILLILKETGGADSTTLLEKLQTNISDLERDIATLRHMEKLRGELQQGEKFFRLW